MNEDKKHSRFEDAEEQLKKFTGLAIRIAIIILFAVGAWRLAWSGISIDLSKFDFSDLLALILALFAVAMSVAFYFKSTDSSNQFYDNIYNFTQKTSEILGRIEERFGEQLRHLDEGYGRIESRFDGMSKSPDEIEEKVEETKGKEEEQKQKLEETNRAMRDLMEELTVRASLQQQEKEEFYEKLGALAAEKDNAQERIREIEADRDRMQKQLVMMEREMEGSARELHSPIIEEFTHHPEMQNLLMHEAPIEMINHELSRFIERYPKRFISELRSEGVLNDEMELTKSGYVMLRSMIRRQRRRMGSNKSR